MEFLDQIFVRLKQWVLSWDLWPEAFEPVLSALLSITPILMVFPLLFALMTVLERKGLGRIQNRLGPNRVGPYGFLQFAADGLKMLTKEDVVPRAADKALHFLAPVVLMVPVMLSYAVIPYGRNMVPIDLEAGFLFFFAVGSATELSVFMAGWSSRNKYALLGAMRSIAQMISYEIPLLLSALTVVMLVGSMSLVDIVAHQSGYWLGVWPQWHVFTPWGLAGFLLFFVATLAETNRSPFDLPEAESEIIAGYFVEYSGFKFALFFLGEYLGMFAISGLGITLFLGGWHAPLGFLTWVPSWLWFFLKLAVILAVFIWIRGTLPRLRADQLMNFAWKFMLPMTLVNIVVAAGWHLAGEAGWPAWLRWGVGGGILLLVYRQLGRPFETSISRRTYRFAE